MKEDGIYLHSLPIRIWHWANALIIFVLIITGVELRFTGAIFTDYGFVVVLHKYAGYLLTLSFLFWIVVYRIVGGFARHYIISMKDIRSIPAQVAYYVYGYFRGRPNPFTPSARLRFNALQKMAYSFLMFVAMPLIIVTGILFSNIMDFYGVISLVGGLRTIDVIHVIVGYVFVIYLIVHLYMATLGKHILSHTKAMITGKEDEQDSSSITN